MSKTPTTTKNKNNRQESTYSRGTASTDKKQESNYQPQHKTPETNTTFTLSWMTNRTSGRAKEQDGSNTIYNHNYFSFLQITLTSTIHTWTTHAFNCETIPVWDGYSSLSLSPLWRRGHFGVKSPFRGAVGVSAPWILAIAAPVVIGKECRRPGRHLSFGQSGSLSLLVCKSTYKQMKCHILRMSGLRQTCLRSFSTLGKALPPSHSRSLSLHWQCHAHLWSTTTWSTVHAHSFLNVDVQMTFSVTMNLH